MKRKVTREDQRKAFNERTELILKMQAEGMSQKSIADSLGLSKARIQQHILAFKLSLTKAQKELLAKFGTPAKYTEDCHRIMDEADAKKAAELYQKRWEDAGK